jgi:hypothetical protein
VTAEVTVTLTRNIARGGVDWKISDRRGWALEGWNADRTEALNAAFAAAYERAEAQLLAIEHRFGRVGGLPPPMDPETPRPTDVPDPKPLCTWCRQPASAPPAGPFCCPAARMWGMKMAASTDLPPFVPPKSDDGDKS